jgi:hypothetical protein
LLEPALELLKKFDARPVRGFRSVKTLPALRFAAFPRIATAEFAVLAGN